MTSQAHRIALISLYAIILAHSYANAQLNHEFEVAFSDSLWPLDTMCVMKPDASYLDYHLRVSIPSQDSGSVMIIRQRRFKNRAINDTVNVISLSPEPNWSRYHSLTLLQFVDINMDGFDDIFVLDGVEEIRDIEHYDIWLFKPKTGKFQYSEDFSQKVYPQYVMDEARKTITSSWVAFPHFLENGSDTYKVRGDKLTLIDRVTQSFDSEHSNDTAFFYIWKHEKMVNGVLRVIKQVRITEEEAQKE